MIGDETLFSFDFVLSVQICQRFPGYHQEQLRSGTRKEDRTNQKMFLGRARCLAQTAIDKNRLELAEPSNQAPQRIRILDPAVAVHVEAAPLVEREKPGDVSLCGGNADSPITVEILRKIFTNQRNDVVVSEHSELRKMGAPFLNRTFDRRVICIRPIRE